MFGKKKEAFESKCLKVNLGKINMIVSGVEGGVIVSKAYPSGSCG